MSKVALVTDSTAYIPQDLVKKYDIRVAPQTLVWGPETYRDGVDIQPSEFYAKLRNSKVMPTTSQATPQAFQSIFADLLASGHEVLAVLIAEKLSGTMASACQAKELFPSNAPITIFDSTTAAMAMGFQVLEAARAAEGGASLTECLAVAEKARGRVGVVFAVETLEFLHRGGRIGGAARLLGSALNIKPILELKDGHVEAIDKVRTRKKSLLRLLELTEERIAGRQPVHLAVLHANSPADAHELLDEAVAQFHPVESVFSEVSPVVGNHAGPGTVGLAFLAGM